MMLFSRGSAPAAQDESPVRWGEAMAIRCTTVGLAILACFTLSLALLPAIAGAPISAPDARHAAQAFVESIAKYSDEHPGAPATVIGWLDGRVGPAYLVRRYADLAAAYYLVPVESASRRYVGLVGLDPATGKMWWYSSAQNRSSLFAVDETRAREAISKRFGFTPAEDDLLLVGMPNKRLYWLFRLKQLDVLHEYFVSVMDAEDVHTDAGALGAGFSPPLNKEAPTPDTPPLEPAPDAAAPLLYPTSYDIAGVPYHMQGTYIHCGPASNEMTFDYWGPDVNQTDIGHVASTGFPPGSGTTMDNLLRSVQFSSISTAVLDPTLHGYRERGLGYGAAANMWSLPSEYPDRYNDLKRLIANDLPLTLATYYDAAHGMTHARVVKGYNDSTNPKVFIVHDPWPDPPYTGPDVNFEQAFFVDNLWNVFNRWGMLVAPWNVSVSSTASFACCAEFTVSASVLYRGPHPFTGSYPAQDPQASITLPDGFSLAAGETASKPVAGISGAGTSGSVAWQVVAPCISPSGTVVVEGKGLISGISISYPSYQDWIGGTGQADVQGGSAEVCDNLDNDCDGTVDNGFIVPGMVAGLSVLPDRITFTWSAEPQAERYDVVRGDVVTLLAAGGDFGASLLACVEDDSVDTSALDELGPAPGAAFYYLVRAERACRSGTYDDGGAGQVGDRDAGVAASPSRCP